MPAGRGRPRRRTRRFADVRTGLAHAIAATASTDETGLRQRSTGVQAAIALFVFASTAQAPPTVPIDVTIVASIAVDEWGHKWSMGQPRLIPSKKAGATVRVSASNSFEVDEPPKNFVIELGLPGKYRVRR